MWIEDQIEAIRLGGERGHNAALALGFLLERLRRPGDAMTEEIRLISGDDVASRHLSPAEAEEALDQLLQLLESTPVPPPILVWAVGRNADPRTIGPLGRVLDRTAFSPDSLDTAREALQGLMLFDEAEAESAIGRVADGGEGELRENARAYLQRHKRAV